MLIMVVCSVKKGGVEMNDRTELLTAMTKLSRMIERMNRLYEQGRLEERALLADEYLKLDKQFAVCRDKLTEKQQKT